MSVGPMEIMAILVVALVVFGPQRLPEVGRQVGAAVRELRRMQDTVRGELDMVLHPEHGTSSVPAEIEPGDHTVYAESDGVDDFSVEDIRVEDIRVEDIVAEPDRGFAGPPDSFT